MEFTTHNPCGHDVYGDTDEPAYMPYAEHKGYMTLCGFECTVKWTDGAEEGEIILNEIQIDNVDHATVKKMIAGANEFAPNLGQEFADYLGMNAKHLDDFDALIIGHDDSFTLDKNSMNNLDQKIKKAEITAREAFVIYREAKSELIELYLEKAHLVAQEYEPVRLIK